MQALPLENDSKTFGEKVFEKLCRSLRTNDMRHPELRLLPTVPLSISIITSPLLSCSDGSKI